MTHEEIVARFPRGLTVPQFKMLALESADDEGVIDPPSMADWFSAQSILISMWMDGLIERKSKMHESGPWFITDKGRAFMQSNDSDRKE